MMNRSLFTFIQTHLKMNDRMDRERWKEHDYFVYIFTETRNSKDSKQLEPPDTRLCVHTMWERPHYNNVCASLFILYSHSHSHTHNIHIYVYICIYLFLYIHNVHIHWHIDTHTDGKRCSKLWYGVSVQFCSLACDSLEFAWNGEMVMVSVNSICLTTFQFV